MKAAKNIRLGEVAGGYGGGSAMVRTQIYLSREEHQFLQSEAARQRVTMAGIIRALVDEKMSVPAPIWANNPLLEETPTVEGFGHADGARNHDHYIYGSPKLEPKKPGKQRRS
ncbi:MAG: hypothetical protein JWM99_5135 [Verrucomicrobiales bacterium]|nr:hypothetical protein [Verrucomicrobiales bacterium]